MIQKFVYLGIGLIGAWLIFGTRKKPNIAFDVATDYLNELSLNGITLTGIDAWIKEQEALIKSIYERYLTDKRLHGSNDDFYGGAFEVALQHKISRHLSGKSSLDIANGILASFPATVADAKMGKWKGYPEMLKNKYRQALADEKVQYPWYADKSEMQLEAFMVAWHDKEKI